MAASHGPNIENLRKQSKALLRSWQRGDDEARDRVAEYFPIEYRLNLQAAQLILAREYGFASWTALTDYVPRMGYFDDIACFRITREFDITPERLWKAVSTPEEIGTWFLPVSFEPRVGASYAFHSRPPMTGKLGDFQCLSSIRFDSGNGAHWHFAIEPLEDCGTTQMRLTIEDRMTLESVEQFPGGITEAWNPGVTSGWHEILDSLEHHLTGQEAPKVDYSQLCRFYERVLQKIIEDRSP